MELKIGILLPRSDMYQGLAIDVMNGIKLAMKTSDNSSIALKYLVEGVGNAADHILIKEAEKMILQEDVALTISFCGAQLLEELIKIHDGYKKPLIHIDLGGNVLRKKFTSPYVVHHTLNLWQSTYAAGMYAAKNLGKKATVASSFYDGGYHLTASFVQGFEDHGGTIAGYYVSPMDYRSDPFDKLIETIKTTDPDLLFALFSYNEGKKVFEVLSQSEFNGKIPIMAIPLMTDEVINTENYDLKNVSSMASWAFDDESASMCSFVDSYQTHYEDAPNIMGLLGFEVGLLISNCMNNNERIPSKIGEYFSTQHIESPRGTLSFNAHNESQVKKFKLRKFNFNQVKYHNTVTETMDVSFIEELYEKFETLPDSSWKNPYICT